MTIIRDMPTAKGSKGWVLLSQVEHARLAGEIAAAWGGPKVAPLVPRDPIVDAVFHHDDGWLDWEQQPGVDTASGRPFAFTEMPDDTKFDLWRKSIAAAHRIGLLEAAIVARHFIGLELGTNRWQQTEGHTDANAQAFVDEFTALSEDWLAQWRAASPAHTDPLARKAREWLQMFDVMSLWLCMADRHVAKQLELPAGGQIVLTPLAADRIRIEPWPLAGTSLRLEIVGRHVAERKYASSEDLASAPSLATRLCWDLVPV